MQIEIIGALCVLGLLLFVAGFLQGRRDKRLAERLEGVEQALHGLARIMGTADRRLVIKRAPQKLPNEEANTPPCVDLPELPRERERLA